MDRLIEIVNLCFHLVLFINGSVFHSTCLNIGVHWYGLLSNIAFSKHYGLLKSSIPFQMEGLVTLIKLVFGCGSSGS